MRAVVSIIQEEDEYDSGFIVTFFSETMSIQDVTGALIEVMKQNRDVLIKKDTTGSYQITGNVNGVNYVLGINNGRVGQFYPK